MHRDCLRMSGFVTLCYRTSNPRGGSSNLSERARLRCMGHSRSVACRLSWRGMAANKVTAVHRTLEVSTLRLGAVLATGRLFFAVPRFREHAPADRLLTRS